MVQNSEGEPVDPVPFVVVTGMFFLVCYSFFPVYFLSLGVGLPAGLALTTSIFLALAAGAYNRLVRSFRPEVRREVPAEIRLQKIFYYAIIVTGVFLFLTMILMA
ncbi:hypothetical protein [Halovenus salina]|uniref:hypothetical protein n=1 Tax=Halovenus salina TaxID=1510225 RepID=UPI002260AC3F|nr:hypothetical protein [Halovenus salina]